MWNIISAEALLNMIRHRIYFCMDNKWILFDVK